MKCIYLTSTLALDLTFLEAGTEILWCKFTVFLNLKKNTNIILFIIK